MSGEWSERLESLLPSPEVRKQLLQTRMLYKTEMQAACRCRGKREKLALVKRWRKKYPPSTVENLLRVAKNEQARVEIAKWRLDEQ